MRKIGIDELRQKQMEILDYVTKFCDNNDICYILEGGTLLGAVRHKGYIPWDDDIDIGMLREDYERFTDLFPKLCDRPGYVFNCCEKDKTWHIPFGKVMDMNTLFVQDGYNLGINIDVFPYDDTPNDPRLVTRMYKMRDRLKYLNAAQQRQECPSGNVLRRVVVHCIRVLLHRFPDYYFVRRISERAKKWKGRGLEWIGDFVSESYPMPIEKRIVRDRIDVEFEGRTYKIPHNYDAWLTAWFGDYMTLPPEEERKRHSFEAYLPEEGEMIERA